MARRSMRSLSTFLEYDDDVTIRFYQSSQRHHGGQDMERLPI
jgi:hypothetical protein